MGQELGTVLDGKYEIIRLLGEGGMGAVYEATHRLIGRRLAVKFLHPQYASNPEVVTRFQREAQAAAQIGHENIIEVTDMGTAVDGSPYIVMEYLEGCDVKHLIEEEGVQEPNRAAHIMVQALSALQAAHDVGIIHRDLKPENIFLISKGGNPDYVKLLDFGISKFRSLETNDAKGLTQTGTVLGTPHYMSPEQARGEQNLTPRSDVYAMGVILYQMLTGHLPFDAPNYNALLIKILTEDPPLPEVLNPSLPVELVNTIKRAMHRDVTVRFEDCIDFRNELVPFAPGSTEMTGSVSTQSRTSIRKALYSSKTPFEMTQSGIEPERKKSKLPLLLGTAAAAVVVAVVAGVMLLSGSADPTPTKLDVTAPPIGGQIEVKATEEKVVVPENQTEAADATNTDAAANTINFSVQVIPAEATILLDNVELGTNPFAGSFPKGDVNHALVVKADGYKTESTFLEFKKDLDLKIELTKEKQSGKSSGQKHPKDSGGTTSGGSSSTPAVEKPAPSEPKSGGKGGGKKPNRKIDYDDPWKS